MVTVSYPGVYIQEAPSSVHAITGVATSITAFVGRAARGPVNTPVTLNSWADMQRQFGGLWTQSRLGFAVYDFFNNGGSQAIVVRLCHTDADSAEIDLGNLPAFGGDLILVADPGGWGSQLSGLVDHLTRHGDATLFNLTVTDPSTPTPLVETYRNVSLDPSNPRYLPNVLVTESTLVTVKPLPTGSPAPVAPFDPPTAKTYAVTKQGRDGTELAESDFTPPEPKSGLMALENVDLFNLLVIPPYLGADAAGNPIDVNSDLIGKAATYCEGRRAFLLVDSPSTWQSEAETIGAIATAAQNPPANVGTGSANAAVFFPRLQEKNPLTGNLETFTSAGAVAGVFAATDAQRGVWKAPAGLAATLQVPGLARTLTDAENGQLNPWAVNCLRRKPGAGSVVWGARTLQGADANTSQWKYIPVRRLALFLEESLYRGTQWVVFEPNDEPLWAQIRLNITSFMQGLFLQGAFQGTKPKDAFFVKCDSETTTHANIDNGIVNIVVGFAPLLPAEFVVITLQQLTGQAAT
jgi:phage tail sheath protein FI